MNPSRSRAEQASDTRQALLSAARRLFAEQGYAATGTEEIVAAAKVGTRGALYHHFEDKKALFQAVLRDVQADLADAAALHVDGGDALEILGSSLGAFLDEAAVRSDVQQILLIDGPSVLGWEAWRSIEAEYGIAGIQAVLNAAVDADIMEPQPLRPLSHLLLALVDEAALYIANAPEPELARVEVGDSIDHLLGGLRKAARP